MDPSSIPPSAGPATNTLPMPTIPATVPFLQEPNNHSPPPPASTGTNAAPSHPPYAEMIYTAIEALKEKEGSSKRAIAKYIEQVYKEQLPPTHSTLLTHHLNRLKNNGMLQMVKKSYRLPRSADATDPNPSPSGSSRPRGRPRKAQIQPQPQSQLPQLEAQPQPQLAGNVNVNVPQQQQQNAEPVWAALGLADEPAVQPGSELKKRGRPKKNEVAPGAAETPNTSLAVATPGRRGRPPGSKNSKRKPGRPPKASPAGGPAAASGRPAKNQQVATPVTFAAVSDPDAAVTALPPAPVVVPAGGVPVAGSPRPRGRPKRILGEAVTGAIIPVAVGATGRGRGRGRGRARGYGFGTFGRGRGRGRGRPVGRPRKDIILAGTSQNEDLRRKLEHFQAKVKESLAVLRPYFNHESPVTALAALQELDVLGTMDLNAPLRDETIPQQPQQQLPLQQQPPPMQPSPSPPPPPQPHQQLPQPQLMFPQQFHQFNLPQFQQQPPQYQHQHQPPPQQQLFHP
ncbi:LOW QUALITY PROTEIN: uncharacterized protein LOC107490665 [Arachis duranensis]|uniref:LOW QUALITY PROTEIN: uncharacterized protein LOC107490665 n=1 Tax=Arachis duranensis TaxID=130453 RepID=A0A6P4DEG9_ARADU|nr:LOW QUALITY PROTEIN: uncharacterized protein LOC107490665 [Arachis duranensis]